MCVDLNALVGSKVNVVAKVGKVFHYDRHDNDKIILKDIYLDGIFWRNHAYIKSTKRLKHLCKGDVFAATAEPYLYIDVDTNRCDKIGLSGFRSVVVVGL